LKGNHKESISKAEEARNSLYKEASKEEKD
jgi:hypothetical protein